VISNLNSHVLVKKSIVAGNKSEDGGVSLYRKANQYRGEV
jgi:hypothetical protein